MKLLVTGATGFIGNYVIRELISAKQEVYATSKDDIKRVKTFDWFEKVKYIQFDLKEPKDNYFEFFEKPDVMIHLAWEGLPNYNDLIHIEKNLFYNYFFIKNMIENGLKNISIIGTCAEYGMQNGCLAEDLITKPSNLYGLAKDTLRKFVIELSKKYEINYKWIRLFYLYGKGQNENSMLEQLKRAIDNDAAIFNMSGGEQLRDYLPVEKVAEYIVKISLQNKINDIINCCSGRPISIRKLVENYLTEINKNIELNLGYYPYPEYEPMAFWGNNKKLKEILKYYE